MRQQTLLRIIGLMRKEIDKGKTILGISKELSIGYRPAYNHIAAMEKEGIIRIERIGHATYCRLNLNQPQTRHLLASFDLARKDELYKKHQKLKTILESLISKLVEVHISSLHAIILFGSYAKGKATKRSDIDLLFIVSNLHDKTLRKAIEMESASYRYSYNIHISPLITDIDQFKKMLSSKELNVGKEVKNDGISLYGHEIFWRILS